MGDKKKCLLWQVYTCYLKFPSNIFDLLLDIWSFELEEPIIKVFIIFDP